MGGIISSRLQQDAMKYRLLPKLLTSSQTALRRSSRWMKNCFVSKGFEHVTLGASDTRDVILQLGHMQTESIPHLERLKTAGCPVRDMDSLANQKALLMTRDEIYVLVQPGKP